MCISCFSVVPFAISRSIVFMLNVAVFLYEYAGRLKMRLNNSKSLLEHYLREHIHRERMADLLSVSSEVIAEWFFATLVF